MYAIIKMAMHMKDKITIGIFIDTFFPMIDGVVMVVDNYAKRLKKYANVIVFAPNIDKNFNDKELDYKVVRCHAIKIPFVDYSLPLPKLDYNFKQTVKEYKLDIVHIHSPATLGLLGINYAKKHNIPVIGTMHSQYKKDFKRALKSEIVSSSLAKEVTKIYSKCDEVWAVNEEVAKILKEDYGYKGKPRIMYNATEMTKIQNKDEANKKINNLHNLNEADKILLFVGRINKLKNIFFIIDALKILENKNFKYKMLFVGTGQDEEELKNYIKEKNVKNIIMCGKVTDRKLLSYYYNRADLFLFPSLYDCSSIVQIEAASQNTPGLFLKGAATANTVKDNIDGFLSENNPEKYANKIIEILNNQELYNKVAKNTYTNLYKNWDDIVKEVYEIYLKFIKEK